MADDDSIETTFLNDSATHLDKLKEFIKKNKSYYTDMFNRQRLYKKIIFYARDFNPPKWGNTEETIDKLKTFLRVNEQGYENSSEENLEAIQTINLYERPSEYVPPDSRRFGGKNKKKSKRRKGRKNRKTARRI